MKKFLNQIKYNEFKPSNFTIFNIIEDAGFVNELQFNFNERYSIDDFEYLFLDLELNEINGIKYHMSIVMDKIKDLKSIIEKQIQDDELKPKSRIFVNHKDGYVFIVKLINFNLIERVEKIIGDEKSSPIEIE